MERDQLVTELRAIADRRTHAQWGRDAREALRGAADELERLTHEPSPNRSAEPRETYVGEVLDGFVAPGGHLFAAIVLPVEEARRLVDVATPRPWAVGTELELDALGRDLAARGGVPEPEPQPRRFAANYRNAHAVGDDEERFYPTPAPGSFVFGGPALAVWRVLSVERLEGDTRGSHVFGLEAVDAHDVPTLSRVETLFEPLTELPPADVEPKPIGAATGAVVALCSATYTPSPSDHAVDCVRVHGHPGEHLVRWVDSDSDDMTRELAIDFPWDGPPRLVRADSPRALEALEREGGQS